jgi:hypothetical protein
MSIRQINLTYVREHDRVLLRLSTANNEELSAWFTRYILLRFIPEFDKVIAEMAITQDPRIAVADDHSKHMVAEFQREEQLKSADFKSAYQKENLKPLIEGSPLLVTGLSMRKLATNQLQLVVTESLHGQQRQIDLKMNEELYYGFSKLLHQVIEKTAWTQVPTNQASQDLSEGSRPAYLN